MKKLAIAFTLLLAASSFANVTRCGSKPTACVPCDIKVVDVHEVQDSKCPQNEVMVGHDVEAMTLSCGKLQCSSCSPVDRLIACN